MAITLIIRGDDHLSNTARQELLRRALYPAAPAPVYAHLAMILAPGGGKLSKRHGATSVGDYRRLGYLPQAIVNYLALLSWSHGDDEVLGIDRLIASFESSALSASPAIFDMGKLDWLNHQWIMASSDADHERLVAERLPAGTPAPAVRALAAAFKPSLERYGDVPQATAPVLERPVLDAATREAARRPPPIVWALFAGLRRPRPPPASPPTGRELLGEYRRQGKERGFGPRELLMPLRRALTGREHGPELHFVLAALEAGETLERLARPPAPSRRPPARPPPRPKETNGDQALQLTHPAQGGACPARPRQGRHLRLRPHGLQPRAHRQRPSVRRLCRAARLAYLARLRRDAGREHHRRERQDQCQGRRQGRSPTEVAAEYTRPT